MARTLEKKGIISDRCELNRQIKADNALLKENKKSVEKFTSWCYDYHGFYIQE